MAGMSNYLVQLIYDLTIAGATAGRTFTSLNSVYVSLHTTDPLDGTELGTEVSYTNYARLELGTTMFDGAKWYNGSDLEFAAVPTGGGAFTVTHWGIYDSQASGQGQLLYSGAFDAPKLIEEGMRMVIRLGQLEVTYV